MSPRRDDTRPLRLLAPYAGGLVGLIAVMTLVFAGVGALRGDGGDSALVAGSRSPAANSAPDSTGDPSPTDAPAPADNGSTPGQPEVEATVSADGPSDESPGESTEDPGTATPAEDPEPAESIPPQQITVQILDAADDEGVAAGDVAATLREDGYRVVAEHPAVRTYEQTTVFYSPGHEASARQIAAQYGFPRVGPMPDNLNDTVRVHVVVGTDRA